MDFKNPQPSEIAERSVLGGILHHGQEAYLDVADIITPDSFTNDMNKVIYNCIRQICEKKAEGVVLDPGLVLSASQECGYGQFFTEKKHAEYLRGLFNFGGTVDINNIRTHGAKIRKLQIARDLQKAALQSVVDLGNINGTEEIEKICFLAEEHIIQEMDKLFGQGHNDIKDMGEGLSDFVQNLIENPQDSFGIPNQYVEYCRAIGGGHIRKELDIIAARAKQGKAETLDSILYTVDGPKLMKDIKIGDLLCHPSGKTTKVIQLHPQGKSQVYKIYFNDGTFVKCNKEHLFTVSHRRNRLEQNCTISIQNLLNKNLNYKTLDGKRRNNYYIKLTKPVKMNKKPLPIHPYVMGVILGDAHIGKMVMLTCFDNQIIENCNKLLKPGYKFKKSKKREGLYLLVGKTNGLNYYNRILKEIGLYGTKAKNKFIPSIYKYNSKKNRSFLLQGLMDTDGYAGSKNIIPEYATKSKKLALDVTEVVESLGGICKLKRRITYCNNIGFYSYRLHISTNNNKQLFKLDRKINAASIRTKTELKRWITKIVKTKKQEEMQCITVDAKDGLYLTNNFIVTHNSFFADNIGFYIAEKFNIPVINIDTELSQEQHWIRLLGIISGVDMNEIKTGQFAKDPEKLAKVRDAEERIKKVPYKYECIGHRSFEDALAILRRWVNKHVGIDENGRRNDCLIIYDYIKLLSEDGLEKNMAEYQKLGFLVTALKNFLIRYDVPCLAFAQLNRDGIDGDSTAAMAGSDRILMYCSSLAFFKPKTLEEMAIGTKYGNRKMHVVAARNGPGTDEETYLHMQFDKNIGRITEVCTQAKVKEEENYKKAFGYEGDDDEDIELPN